MHNSFARSCMITAGHKLAEIFAQVPTVMEPGMSTLALDQWIEAAILRAGLIGECKKVRGYYHVSCISRNDEVVHGVPRADAILQAGDLVKVDVVVSYKGFCADMARTYSLAQAPTAQVQACIDATYQSLDAGIAMCSPGNRVGDISHAIESMIIQKGPYGIVRDFAGHGIGKRMHEYPEILNYGTPRTGPVLKSGWGLAIEPMITMGTPEVVIDRDGWTARTKDGSLAVHVEDTVLVGPEGPEITTRLS